MDKKYLVVGNGLQKETQKPYSRAYGIRNVKDSDYQYLNVKDVIYLDEVKPIGHTVIMTLK